MNAVIPLESNPDIFTQFAKFLGLAQPLEFTDIYSLTDPDLLSFIPRPASCIILLFPITPKYESFRVQEDSLNTLNENENDGLIWFKQTVPNACGLYALLNSISNLPADYFEPGSRILQFRDNHKEIGKIEELIGQFAKEYESFAEDGDTKAPDASEEVNLHFLAMIKKNGKVYEMDGRRTGPLLISNATVEGDDVLEEKIVAERFLKYVELTDDENKLNFSIMGLVPA